MWFFFGISPNNPPKDVARQSDMLMLPPCSRWHWGLAMKMPEGGKRPPVRYPFGETHSPMAVKRERYPTNMSSKSHEFSMFVPMISHEFSMFVTPWYSHYIPWMSHDFHPSSATPLYLHPRQHCSSWSSCCSQPLGDKTLVEWRFSMTKGVNGSGDPTFKKKQKGKGWQLNKTFPDLRFLIKSAFWKTFDPKNGIPRGTLPIERLPWRMFSPPPSPSAWEHSSSGKNWDPKCHRNEGKTELPVASR